MKRALLAVALLFSTGPALGQQTGGLPGLRAQVDALQAAVDALSAQSAGLPALQAQVAALQVTVDALGARFSQPTRTADLRGSFAVAGSGMCIQSFPQAGPGGPLPPLGFTADFQPIGPASVQSFSIEGVRTFNGDGTGTQRTRIMPMGNPGAASAIDLTGAFSYSVAADGGLTIDQASTDAAVVVGLNAGQAQRNSGLLTFVGHVSRDGQALTFASHEPAVETLTRTSPLPEQVISLRICHRTHTGVRID